MYLFFFTNYSFLFIEDEDFLQNPNTSSATNPDEAKSGERFFVKKTCPSSWQKNVRKRNKNCGNPYLNTKGLHIPGKQMDKPCNDKCRLVSHCIF